MKGGGMRGWGNIWAGEGAVGVADGRIPGGAGKSRYMIYSAAISFVQLISVIQIRLHKTYCFGV
jgi:hypothetical protein